MQDRLSVPSVKDMLCIFDEIDRAKAVNAAVFRDGEAATRTAVCAKCKTRFRCHKLADGGYRWCADCTTGDILR